MSSTLVTPRGIASYAYVFKPQAFDAGDEPKYSMSLIIDKDTDLSKMKKACLAVAEEKFGKKAKAMIKAGKLRWPFRDGDEDKPDDELYEGKIFISASNKTKPQVVDSDREPLMEDMDFYSGCICRMSVFPFAYDVKGNKGVSFMLNNIQKLGDGERISGKTTAAEDFDDDYIDDDPGDDFDDDIPF